MRRVLICLSFLLTLAACGAEPVWAPEEDVQRAIYHHGGPPTITLFTMINNRSGEGGHSSLMINGSQRLMFDPAGTWWHRTVPERNDVHFGITPRILDFYIDYHARETYHVVIQTIEVSPEVAELALRQVQNYGAVNKAFCANSVSAVLGSLPGFETIRGTYFPLKIMRRFAELPGVKTETVYDNDSDDNKGVLAAQN